MYNKFFVTWIFDDDSIERIVVETVHDLNYVQRTAIAEIVELSKEVDSIQVMPFDPAQHGAISEHLVEEW